MKITSVRINRECNQWRPNDGVMVLGIVSVVFDSGFVVSHIRVLEDARTRLRRVVMPSRKTEQGYRDVAYPIDDSLREHIRREVLAAL